MRHNDGPVGEFETNRVVTSKARAMAAAGKMAGWQCECCCCDGRAIPLGTHPAGRLQLQDTRHTARAMLKVAAACPLCSTTSSRSCRTSCSRCSPVQPTSISCCRRVPGLGRGRLLGVAWAAMWAAAQIQPRGLHAGCAGAGKGLPESHQQDLAACCALCHSTPDCARLGTAGPLAQAGLSWWSVVSPFGGVGSTAALVFVLLVAGVKAVWEDTKRHQEDKRMNTSVTHRVNPDGGQAGGWGVCAWVGGDTTELCMGRAMWTPQVPVLRQQFVRTVQPACRVG